ncbi:MAG: hypothetical protein WD009_10835 [Phycisphaeraceae bacterium]
MTPTPATFPAPPCAACDYDLRGLTASDCPECGVPIEVSQQQARQVRPAPLGLALSLIAVAAAAFAGRTWFDALAGAMRAGESLLGGLFGPLAIACTVASVAAALAAAGACLHLRRGPEATALGINTALAAASLALTLPAGA